MQNANVIPQQEERVIELYEFDGNNFQGLYKVTNTGKVLSVRKKKEISYHGSNGHKTVALRSIDGVTITYPVAVLVLAFFPIDHKLKEYIRFINGNPNDCRVGNLVFTDSDRYKCIICPRTKNRQLLEKIYSVLPVPVTQKDQHKEKVETITSTSENFALTAAVKEMAFELKATKEREAVLMEKVAALEANQHRKGFFARMFSF